jgi:hypothetical protein
MGCGEPVALAARVYRDRCPVADRGAACSCSVFMERFAESLLRPWAQRTVPLDQTSIVWRSR